MGGMGELVREFIVASRQLRQSRGAVASLTIAIGLSVGANLAIFAQLHDVFAPSSPFPDPATLFVIESTGRYSTEEADSGDPYSRRLSHPDFHDLEQQQRTFTTVGAVDTSHMATMWGADRPRTVCRIFVLPRTLDVLGATPVIGRSLGQSDFEAGAAGVALLTDSAWRKYFATDPSAVGRSIQLDEQPFSVVGIVPGNVAGMLQPRTGLFAAKKNDLCVITPLVRGMAGEANGVMEYLQSEQGRNLPSLLVLGRLRSGVRMAQADTELGLIADRLRQQNPTRPQDFTLRAVPFRAWRTAGVQHLLLMLGVAALLTLLVACANAAGLLMAESVRRAPEFATRIALGATTKHLVRVVVARSLLWSLPGGFLGLVLANVAAGVLRWQVSAGSDSPENPYLRTWMLVISGALTLVVALSSGAAAAWALRGRDLNQALRDGGQTIAGQPRRRAALVLLTMQVAAAVALAFGTGLLLRTLLVLGTSDYGFDRQNGFVIEVRLPRSRYATAREQLEFYDRALSRIRALPGVTASGLSSSPPLTGTETLLSGALRISTPTETRTVDRLHAQFVSSGYFEALGMTLRRGRFFSQEDEQAGGAPIVVDETFCRRFLDGSDPLGAVLWFGQDPLTIVGIVGDTRQSIDVAAVSQPNANTGTVYLSLTKHVRPPTWAFLVVRTSLLRADVARDAIGEIASLDTSAFFGDPRRFTDLILTKTAGQRRLSVLLGVMACIVLLLTAVSLTAALSQLVTLRSREIAIRYCLGAGHRQIIGLTLKHVGAMLGTGLLLGVGGGLMLGRALASQLYGVTSTDVRTLASVSALLLVVSIFAAVGPLRRASRIDLPGTLRSV